MVGVEFSILYLFQWYYVFICPGNFLNLEILNAEYLHRIPNPESRIASWSEYINIADKDRQVDIISDINEVSDDTSHSKAMSAAHLERTSAYEKIAARFFWYGI